jgi:hypothetical protein
MRLSVAEGELSQSNLAIQRQLDTAAETWGQQMAELQAACEQRMAGEAPSAHCVCVPPCQIWLFCLRQQFFFLSPNCTC